MKSLKGRDRVEGCLKTFFEFGRKLCTDMLNLAILVTKAVVLRCSIKKDVLTNFAKFTEKPVAEIPSPTACNFIKKESLAQVFSSEFCEISSNTFFHRTPLLSASVVTLVFLLVTLISIRN